MMPSYARPEFMLMQGKCMCCTYDDIEPSVTTATILNATLLLLVPIWCHFQMDEVGHKEGVGSFDYIIWWTPSLTIHLVADVGNAITGIPTSATNCAANIYGDMASVGDSLICHLHLRAILL